MLSFFKKKPVPEWASFMTPEQYQGFDKALTRHLKAGCIPYNDDNGILTLAGGQPETGFIERVALSELAQECAKWPVKEYEKAIKAFFGLYRQLAENDWALGESTADFEQIKTKLGFWLCSRDFYEETGEGGIGRKIADDLYGQLVFCLPDGSVMGVDRETTAGWDKTDEELIELGLENAKEYPVDSSWTDMGDAGFWVFHSAHYFVPNVIFDLGPESRFTGRHGTLVGLPHHGNALIHPIEDSRADAALPLLVEIVWGMYKDGKQTISPNIYWHNNDVLTNIPYRPGPDGVELFLPENLSEILEQLRAADSGRFSLSDIPSHQL